MSRAPGGEGPWMGLCSACSPLTNDVTLPGASEDACTPLFPACGCDRAPTCPRPPVVAAVSPLPSLLRHGKLSRAPGGCAALQRPQLLGMPLQLGPPACCWASRQARVALDIEGSAPAGYNTGVVDIGTSTGWSCLHHSMHSSNEEGQQKTSICQGAGRVVPPSLACGRAQAEHELGLWD